MLQGCRRLSRCFIDPLQQVGLLAQAMWAAPMQQNTLLVLLRPRPVWPPRCLKYARVSSAEFVLL